MLNLSKPQVFRPIKSSRRPELFAWILAIVLVFTSIFLIVESSIRQILTSVFAVFFVISAILISFGNWVERNTWIELSENRVEYHNGLRHVIISWLAIEEIRVFPSDIGKKILVYSAEKFFGFQTLGELIVAGKLRDRVGFEKGELILETILNQSELGDTMKHQADGFYYYARE